MCNLYLTELSVAFLFPKVKKCNPVDLPRGFLSCSNPNGPFTFGSLCTATCERGFVLNGTVSVECNSLGLWSADIPQCLGKEITDVLKYLKCFSVLLAPSPACLPFSKTMSSSWLSCSWILGLLCSTRRVQFWGSMQVNLWRGFLPEWYSWHGVYLSGNVEHRNTRLSRSEILPWKKLLVCTWGKTYLLLHAWWHSFDAIHSTALPPAGQGSTKRHVDLQPPTLPFKLRLPLWIWMWCGFLAKRSISHNMQQFRRLESGSTHLSAWVFVRYLKPWYSSLLLYPICPLALQCEAIRVFPSSLSVNCSHPVEDPSFGSQCFFSCKEGFSLNGTQTLTCTSTGFWSDTPPTCLGNQLFDIYLVVRAIFFPHVNHADLSNYWTRFFFQWKVCLSGLPCSCTQVWEQQPLLGFLFW